MTLAIDGFSSTAATATTLSTTLTNDIIVVMLVATTSNGITVTAINDTAGLTYHKLIRESGTFNLTGEIWWAYSSGALTSDIITATSTGGAISRMAAFGVNGVNSAYYTNPWDTNASSSLGTNNNNTNSASVTISTNSTNAMLVSLIRSISAVGTVTRPSGFASAGSAGGNEDVAYSVVSSQQSGVAENFSWSGATGENILIVAAITGDAPPAAGTTFIGGFW